jgi:uncharacterized membrane protein YfcA
MDRRLGVTCYFVVGGVGGMFLGQWFARHFPRELLQRVIAVAVVLVAGLILGRTLL